MIQRKIHIGSFYFYQLGSHQGGSSTEYFFGQYNFDGDGTTPYILNFYYNTLLDQGKDLCISNYVCSTNRI